MNIGKVLGALCAFIVICALLIVGFGSWGTVKAGSRGVVMRMGAVTGDVKPEGFYGKTPWIETVHEVNVRVTKEEVSTDAASKDLQTVTTELALNVNIDPSSVARVYQTYGDNAYQVFVDPALKESMKAVIAQYTAEELITKREVVREAIADLIITKLKPAGFNADAINITNFQFSKTFNEAIEAKVTAEQSALAAKNKLDQVKYEAAQAVALAQGKADAMKVETAALQQNQQILELRALEKWDGHLPTYMGGGGLPFLGVAVNH